MQRAIILAVCALAGCTPFRGPGQQSIEFYTTLSPDSVARIAAAQLQQHGYPVGATAGNTVMTQTRALPEGVNLRTPDNKQTKHWMLRVDAIKDPYADRTRVMVQGYAIPDLPPDGANRGQYVGDVDVVPITARNERLFAQVESVANLIRAAATGR